MRNKRSFFNKFDNLLKISLPVREGKGEDNYYCCGPDQDTDKAVIGVFDGSGGLGSRTHKEMGGYTEAYLGSRALAGALHDWFHAYLDKPVPRDKELTDSLYQFFMAAFEVLRENTVENTRIKGALVRSFPATATVVVAENNPEGVLLHMVWAGDSRIYLIDSKGLAQVSKDDVETTDALENLSSDGVMNNVMAADGDFYMHYRKLLVTEPTIVFAASDGCFGYLPTPMEFEYEFLDALCHAETPYEFRNKLASLFKDVAGDDSTLCSMSFLFGTFKEQKKKLQPRLDEVFNRYISPLDECRQKHPDQEHEITRKIWKVYRRNYERIWTSGGE